MENELCHARADAHAAREANRFLLESLSRQTSPGTAQLPVQPSGLAQLQAKVNAAEHDRHAMRVEINQLSTKLPNLDGQQHLIRDGFARQAHQSELQEAGAATEHPQPPNAAYGKDQREHATPSSAQPNIYQSLTSRYTAAPVPDLFAKPTIGGDSYARRPQQHQVGAILQPAFHQQLQRPPPLPQHGTQASHREPDPIQHWKTYAQQEPARYATEERRRYQDWDAEVNIRDTKRAKDLDYGDEEAVRKKPSVGLVTPTARPRTQADFEKPVTPARKLVHSDPTTLDALEGRVKSTVDILDVTNKIDWQPLVPSPSAASGAPVSQTAAATSNSAEVTENPPLSDVTQVKPAAGTSDLSTSKHAKRIAERLPDPFGRSLRSYADLDDDDTVSEASTTGPPAPILSHESAGTLAHPETGASSATAEEEQTQTDVSPEYRARPDLAAAPQDPATSQSDDVSGKRKPAFGRTLRSYADLDDGDFEGEADTGRGSSSHDYDQPSNGSGSNHDGSASEDEGGSDYDSDDDRDAGNDFSAPLNYDADGGSAQNTPSQLPRKILKPVSRTKSQLAQATDLASTVGNTSQAPKEVRFDALATMPSSAPPAAAERAKTTSVDDLTAKLSATSFRNTMKPSHRGVGDGALDHEEGEIDESVARNDKHEQSATGPKPAAKETVAGNASSSRIRVMGRMACLAKGQQSVELDY